MKKVKSIATTLLATTLLASTALFAACETTTNQEDPQNNEPAVEETLEVPYDLSSTAYDFEKEYFIDDYNTKHYSAYNVNVFD
ncbi:MAG: hypothetical protein J6Z36_04065, partial [Clostridia bacterium]|nr:hypothetical protein [Clostridia bacterium]